jgi:hypothetical protein
MKLPKKINVQLVSDSPINLDGLIVMLKVKSGTKNPYYIQFPKTNLQGVAQLTQEDFIGQFMDHFEEALMDYNGTIESAEPIVEISLFDPTWTMKNKKLALAYPLFKHEATKWKTRKAEYNNRITCRNLEFSDSPLGVDIENTDVIKFKVVRYNAA